MVRTRAGYTGGTKKNPTYDDIGDHTETVQIDFDPAQITYQKLLDVFWQSHNPCAGSGKRQYMTAVFYHNDQQKKLALESCRQQAAPRKQKIATAILPASEFYLAEDYHQKFSLRQCPQLLREFQAFYPKSKDFVASTAVARVNGYLGGHGSASQLDMEMPSLGLSDEGARLLRKLVRDNGK